MGKEYFNIHLLKGIILALIGGFIEMYSLMIRGAFSGMQTGNLIYTFSNLFENNYIGALAHFLFVITFIIGIVITEIIYQISDMTKIKYEYFIYLIGLILLISVIFIPVDSEKYGTLNIVAGCLLSFFGALQSHAFTNINKHALSTTMMTAMMKLATSSLVKYIKDKNKENLLVCLEILSIILFFIFGFVVFYILYKCVDINYLNYSLFIPISLVLALFCIAFFKKS